ncbi:hypothetical protein SAMN04489835_0221 [Mycolicibacterium rutilum]|uniref:Uncharacterized protein n=1 Tax=Mycolicibacterium rutilum TaxID=370526 RepID=A0A1H6IMC2_MYCRU|nr:hypothetical protein [Mycolicibacterium rutilum]SEH47431.1 hypothetical protein SAMN04489835_0221 [Mycolicibacterium rutilum]
MPLQNRVTPSGELIATRARGTVMGNRGILHDDRRRIVRSTRNRAWLICRLEFQGRRRAVMSPGSYTELFFLDETVALAAGHRPCGECRRSAYRAFLDAVNASGAVELDRRLNTSRRAPNEVARIADLPDGVFLRIDGDRLKWQGALHRWTPGGYVDPVPVADAGANTAMVLTPALSVDALRHGYAVEVHPTVKQ